VNLLPYSNYIVLILTAIVSVLVGGIAGYVLRKKLSGKMLESSENLSVRIINEAKKEAESIKKEAILQAKDQLLKAKNEFEKETKG